MPLTLLVRQTVLAFACTAIIAACGANRPADVAKSVTVDEKGRKVTLYRVCEPAPWKLSLDWRPVCRVERVTENYCYRSLGNVDCYDQPWPGQSAGNLVR